MNSNTVDTMYIVASGSGGHLLPALEYAKRSKGEKKAERIIVLCTNTPLEKEIVACSETDDIEVRHFKEMPSLNKWYFFPSYLYRFLAALVSIWFYLRKEKNCMLVSTGGALAFPALVAAKWTRTFTLLLELNVIPGKTHIWCAPWADKMEVVFPEVLDFAASHHVPAVLISYPFRSITNKGKKEVEKTLQEAHFSKEKKTILLLGGSQGSKKVVDIFIKWVKNSPNSSEIQCVLQHRPEDSFIIQQLKEEGLVCHSFSYTPFIREYMEIADIIVSRAGSGSLAEIVEAQKQAVILPLSSARYNHQELNAYSIQKRFPHIIKVITEKELSKTAYVFSSTMDAFFAILCSSQPSNLPCTSP